MKNLIIIVLALAISGCAVGNKYSYQASSISIPVDAKGGDSLVLSVKESRPYVLSGDKSPDFVGIQRGGFGNPFNVRTASGMPLTEAMSDAIRDGLEHAGYKVYQSQNDDVTQLVSIASGKGADRVVVLDVKDWKSDMYASITMHVNLVLSIYDLEANILAENIVQFVNSIGRSQLGEQSNSVVVTAEFKKQIKHLFNNDDVRQALQQ